MKTKLVLCLATISLGAAFAAASHSVTLFDTLTVNGTTLKPGDYSVEVSGDKAIFKKGKEVVEAPVTTAENDKKFSSNMVQSTGSALKELDLGGTKLKLVFATPTEGATGK